MKWAKIEEPKLYYNSEAPRSAQGWESRMFSYWPVRYAAIILSCVMFIVWYWKYYSYNSNNVPVSKVSPEPSWDFLLFTQSYPFSCCVWNEMENDGKFCHYSQDPHEWTVHGIWPTKNETEGPIFCNKKKKFNESGIEPIKADLDNRWPSIESDNSTKFWKHEWEKHGTCAIEVPTICDSELSYFQLGLDWNTKYNLTKALSTAGITPSNEITYRRQQFSDAVKSAWGTSPQMMCYNYDALGVFLIQEIRLCLSTNLELIDCDASVAETTNCPTEGILLAENLSFRDRLQL